MKILYLAGPRVGAGEQARRCIQNLPNQQIKIAGYSCHTKYLNNLDWNLDFLYSFFHDVPNLQTLCRDGKLTPQLQFLGEEFAQYAPDLCIADGEPLASGVVKLLGIPLWYCSPLHLIDGVLLRTQDYFYKYQLEFYRQRFSFWPRPDRYLIYSNLNFPSLITRPNYTWINPYSENFTYQDSELNISILGQRTAALQNILMQAEFKGVCVSNPTFSNRHIYGISFSHDEYKDILSRSKLIFLTGETSFLSDALQTEAKLYISPNLGDPETIINACLGKIFEFAEDLGQLELSPKSAPQLLEEAFLKNLKKIEMPQNNQRYLHEEI